MNKFKAGKYELIRETTAEDVRRFRETITSQESIKLDLTAAKAKALMSNHFYDKLGFKSIELVTED